MTVQGLILKLSEFWASRGCVLQQPLDIEVGAGTMHPETFLRVLGPAHWSVTCMRSRRGVPPTAASAKTRTGCSSTISFR